jgi:hypothetical protein
MSDSLFFREIDEEYISVLRYLGRFIFNDNGSTLLHKLYTSTGSSSFDGILSHGPRDKGCAPRLTTFKPYVSEIRLNVNAIVPACPLPNTKLRCVCLSNAIPYWIALLRKTSNTKIEKYTNNDTFCLCHGVSNKNSELKSSLK